MKPNPKGRTHWENVTKTPVGVRGSAQAAIGPAGAFKLGSVWKIADMLFLMRRVYFYK